MNTISGEFSTQLNKEQTDTISFTFSVTFSSLSRTRPHSKILHISQRFGFNPLSDFCFSQLQTDKMVDCVH